MTFDRATIIKATKDSIAHWQRHVDGTAEGEGVDWRYCALCQLFGKLTCSGCPIATLFSTAELRMPCHLTPWTEAANAWYKWRLTFNPIDEQRFRQAAQKEVDFLKDVLEKLEKGLI